MQKSSPKKPVLLPGEDGPEIKAWTATAAAIGFLLGSIPPPRCLLAVSSDLIQVFAILAALISSLLILLASSDPAGEGYFNKDATEVVVKVFDRMRDKMLETLIAYAFAIGMLILAKIICMWFEPHKWAWPICRLAAGLAGFLSGTAIIASLRLIRIQGHAQFLRGMIGVIRADRGSN